jgi:hypothetical protein
MARLGGRADNGIEASFCWQCLGTRTSDYRQQAIEPLSRTNQESSKKALQM